VATTTGVVASSISHYRMTAEVEIAGRRYGIVDAARLTLN
jgi:hypothetical protein